MNYDAIEGAMEDTQMTEHEAPGELVSAGGLNGNRYRCM